MTVYLLGVLTGNVLTGIAVSLLIGFVREIADADREAERRERE